MVIHDSFTCKYISANLPIRSKINALLKKYYANSDKFSDMKNENKIMPRICENNHKQAHLHRNIVNLKLLS